MLQIHDDYEDPESLFYTDEVAGPPNGNGDLSGYTALGRSLAADDENDDQNAIKIPRSSSPVSMDSLLLGKHNAESSKRVLENERAPLIRYASLPLVPTTTKCTHLHRNFPQQELSRRQHFLRNSSQYDRFNPEYQSRTPSLSICGTDTNRMPVQGRYGSVATSEDSFSNRGTKNTSSKHPCSPLSESEMRSVGYIIDSKKVLRYSIILV